MATEDKTDVKKKFPIGCTVIVHGLVKSQEWNDRKGQVLSYTEKGSLKVEFDGTVKQLKPVNLQLVKEAVSAQSGTQSEVSTAAKTLDSSRTAESTATPAKAVGAPPDRQRSRSRSPRRRNAVVPLAPPAVQVPAPAIVTPPAVVQASSAQLVMPQSLPPAAPPAVDTSAVVPAITLHGDNFRGRGRGRGIDGGSGRGRGTLSAREVNISKALAKVLRHSAESRGLIVRPDGYIEADAVLRLSEFRSMGCKLGELERLISSNDKQRFQMMMEPDGQLWIRAAQGHSMKSVNDEDLLTPLTEFDFDLPDFCVHGTYRQHKESILQQGLLPGGGHSDRNHVHFAPFEPGDGRVISGMRYYCEIAIYLDLLGAMLDGIPFFKSANGVILSPGKDGVVAVKHIQKVKDLATGQLLYQSPASK